MKLLLSFLLGSALSLSGLRVLPARELIFGDTMKDGLLMPCTDALLVMFTKHRRPTVRAIQILVDLLHLPCKLRYLLFTEVVLPLILSPLNILSLMLKGSKSSCFLVKDCLLFAMVLDLIMVLGSKS